jgi:adenosylcobinamide kinase / adenosylcobinamide-phosphate guanylyltransferase
MPLVLLLGGARSGKSRLALRMALRTGAPVTFIATGQPGDAEMASRIDRHRRERPAAWRTIDEPRDLAGALGSAGSEDCVVVDCLTLWVSNLLASGARADDVADDAAACAAAAAARTAATIVVSGEVGLGVVPANELARAYRDVLGAVNAAFAREAHRALLVVAGRAVELSPLERVFDGGDAG